MTDDTTTTGPKRRAPARKAAKASKGTKAKKAKAAKRAGPLGDGGDAGSGAALVIVESPTKARSIGRYLGRGYDVRATVGHLRDLPTRELGVDVDRGFAPTYVTIKGKTIVGKKLKAKVAGWAPAGLTYNYQWLRNGKVIKGATAKKYLLVAKDKGKKLQVRVTGSKSGYTSGVATSKKTGKIQDA